MEYQSEHGDWGENDAAFQMSEISSDAPQLLQLIYRTLWY
jgi:hypothetical protein